MLAFWEQTKVSRYALFIERHPTHWSWSTRLSTSRNGSRLSFGTTRPCHFPFRSIHSCAVARSVPRQLLPFRYFEFYSRPLKQQKRRRHRVENYQPCCVPLLPRWLPRAVEWQESTGIVPFNLIMELWRWLGGYCTSCSSLIRQRTTQLPCRLSNRAAEACRPS